MKKYRKMLIKITKKIVRKNTKNCKKKEEMKN